MQTGDADIMTSRSQRHRSTRSRRTAGLQSWPLGFGLVVLTLASPLAAAQPQDAPSAGQPVTRGKTRPGSTPSPDVAKPGTQVEQIVVTVNKRRELARTVANSVTAISGSTLDRRQQISVQDLVAEVPGLSVEADQKTAVRIVLRGLNTGGGGTTVASVLDDVPINPEGAQNNASTNSPNLETFDLSRIEVLRGPQSSLYGATAEGGLIKYVTNPPVMNLYSGALEGGFNGVTGGGVGGSLKGFANLPIIKDQLAVRITAWNEWLPGYVDDPAAGKSNSNSGQQYGWRASALWTPSVLPGLSVRLTAERQTLIVNNADFVQVAGAAVTPLAPGGGQLSLVNGLRNNTLLTSPGQSEVGTYYANVSYDMDWATVTSITSYAFNNFSNHADTSNQNIAAGTSYSDYFGSVYGQPIDFYERQDSDTDKFNQELRIASDPGTRLFGRQFDWLGGFFFTRENEAFQQFFDARPTANLAQVLSPALGGATVGGPLSEYAFFGQVDYHLLPSFDVALGGRWSGNAQRSQASYGCCVLYGPTLYLPQISSNSHDALYSVEPRWRPTDNTMLYGRLATGYRPGGPNIPVPGVPGIPNTYQPDSDVSYEVGVRQDLFDKHVSVDVTGYWVNWHNVQIASIFNTPAGDFTVNGNAGSASSKGVEWDIAWVPVRGLTLEAVGDYADAHLDVDAPGLGGARGDALPYVPVMSGSLNADYNWHIDDKTAAFVSGSWSFVGTRYTSFSPTPAITSSHVPLPAYATGSIRLGLSRGAYRGELYVNNISNVLAFTYYSNTGGADQTGQATFIQPRTIGMLLRAAF